jgi:hypothetical protein
LPVRAEYLKYLLVGSELALKDRLGHGPAFVGEVKADAAVAGEGGYDLSTGQLDGRLP